MWNVISLAIGLAAGIILAQPAGLCDGTLQDVLKQRIEKFKGSVSNLEFTYVNSATAQDTGYGVEPTKTEDRIASEYTPEIKLEDIWVPKVLELHESSIEYITPPGFGTIKPCDVSEKCPYSIDFKVAGSSNTKVYYYSNIGVVNAAATAIAESISDEVCSAKERDTLYNVNILRSFTEQGLKVDAYNWHERVTESLSLANSSLNKTIIDLNKLHDDLLDMEAFNESDEQLRIGHPSGDIYMHQFELITYNIYQDKMFEKCGRRPYE